MKTISIPTNDRSDLLRQCLASIQAAISHEQWTLVFSSEPNSEIDKIISGIKFCPVYVNRNPVKMGCWVNTFLAVNFADALGSEFNLYLEDDVLLSKDALLLAEAFRLLNRSGILALRRYHPQEDLNRPADVSLADYGLLGDGFAYQKRYFPWLRKHWFHGDAMWDLTLDQSMEAAKVPCWRPLVQRSQNIGYNGTHMHDLHDPNRSSPCYHGPPVTSFYFVK